MNSAPAESWIVGCGDIGRRLAARLITAGSRVVGWVRSDQGATKLEALGIVPRSVDLDAEMASIDAAPAWLFWFAPPPNSGSTDPRLARFLAALRTPPQRLIYLSTSAVYGDCGGAWIDEDAALNPASDRGRRRLDAERIAHDYGARSGCEVLILRVPGIYGPGRMPEARLRAGTPILRAQDSPYTNRIHADDLATAALIVAQRGAAGAAYNVADGAPTTMSDYFLRCAERLGLPPPPQISLAQAQQQLPASIMSFLEESKRLRSDRLRALGWTPRYPDLESGLAKLIDSR
ncbi:MAG: family oxidoreductase [Nevskia sp.]|nr:family oxidoreductase [Nevskia sp.]